jgi:murein DD-endopeptidase MepM/ murein hydrolase activator NlpD
MKEATVKVGQNVKRGEQIGKQGNEDQRGISSGSHLHLNLFKGPYSGKDTANIDPLMNGLAIPAAVKNPKGCK